MWLCGETTPSATTIFSATPSSRSMAQRKVFRNQWNGRAMSSATRSARARLRLFGTSSPRTTCRTVSRAEGDDESNAVSDNGRPRPRNLLDERRRNRSQRDLAEVAKRQAGDRDADLHAGNDAAEIGEQRFDDFGARIALFDELADARKPHGDERKLRRGEKRVHADEQKHREELKGNHRAAGLA